MRYPSGKIVIFFVVLVWISNAAFAEQDNAAAEAASAKENWKKNIALGFNFTSGNSDTVLINFIGTLEREKKGNIWSFQINGNQGDTDDQRTQDDLKGDLAYKRLLSERAYLGTGISALYDDIADIRYRTSINLSPGYFLLKDEDFKLGIDAGPAYIFEKTGCCRDDYLAVRGSYRFEWQVSKTGKFFQGLETLVSTEDSQNYIINSDAGVEAAITSLLSLVVSVTSKYDNIPAEGKEEHDLAVVSALKVKLD